MSFVSSSSAHDLIAALVAEGKTDAERERLFHELVSQPITSELLVGSVQVLREKMIPVDLSADAMDTSGTGGSGLQTINTSTLSAFIVAAAGGNVAKHGSRSQTGNCGCFDLLDAVGIRTDLQPPQERKLFDVLGIVFLFAYFHHPALGLVAPLRKRHGKKTLFNILGPLLHPAKVKRQMIGTGNAEHAGVIAHTLHTLGSFGSLVVRGNDGLDEVTVTEETTVRLVKRDAVTTSVFSPRMLGLPFADPASIMGGTPAENARVFVDLLEGRGDEPYKHLILVNAAHALLVAKRADSIENAYLLAEQTLASGAALKLFTNYRELSHCV